MNEINNLYNDFSSCDNWTVKLDLIKTLKQKINEEESIINSKIDNLDEIVKVSKKKLNLQTLIDDFDATDELDKKIQIYQQLNSFINKLTNELFSQ